MKRIILASESPRRKEIMKTMGIPFEIITANVIERVTQTEPNEMVQALAMLKTKPIMEQLIYNKEDYFIIIGADTMVFYQEKALGKPRDEAHAAEMLRMLSGNSHQVYTGVSIVLLEKGIMNQTLSFAVKTEVVVQPLSEKQILDYIATKEPMDKAGAYGIQGAFGIFIKEIMGDYYNVVGFPIAKIYEELLNVGIDIKNLKDI